MIANVYCGETKLNSSPLSVAAASQLMLQLVQEGASNIWMEALVDDRSKQSLLVHDDNLRL